MRRHFRKGNPWSGKDRSGLSPVENPRAERADRSQPNKHRVQHHPLIEAVDSNSTSFGPTWFPAIGALVVTSVTCRTAATVPDRQQLPAIALQSDQSLWGSAEPNSLPSLYR